MADETILVQLIKKGFKESPVNYVERLWKKRNEWLNKPIWKESFRKVIETKVSHYDEKITKICTERSIGNPLKGEEIEYQSTNSISQRSSNKRPK